MKRHLARFLVPLLVVCIVLAMGVSLWIYLANRSQGLLSDQTNEFHPFVGHWFGHARELIFYPDGHATYAGRVSRWCDVDHVPCDSAKITGGIKENLQFTHVVGSAIYGTIVSGTDDYGPAFDADGRYNPQGKLLLKVGSSISLLLKANDKLVISDGWMLCRPQTAQRDPGCSSATLQPVSLIKILGTIQNLAGYCQSIGDSTASLDGKTAYDWHCVAPSGQHIFLSMTSACRWQYHDSQALDRLVDYFDPYSWQCFTNAQRLGRVQNLAGYCQSVGDSTASLNGETAYDWHCVAPSGQHIFLSMTSACRWQYHDSQALDRLVDYFDPYSWQCWG